MFNFNGKWLCDERFLKYEPLNMLHKNSDEKRHKELEAEHPKDLKNVRVRFLGSFNFTDNWDSVIMRFSADDYAKVKINGKLAAIGPCIGYSFNYYYNEIDITNLLKRGSNTVESDVTYTGLINRSDSSGDLRMGFIADFIGVKDGKETLIYATDESWKYTVLKMYPSNNTVGYDTQFVEDYDSRLEPKTEDFVPCVSMETDYIFEDQPAVSLQFYDIYPKLSEKLPNGGLFYDIGQEITGTLNITAKGKDGNKVLIYCAEETDDSELKVRYCMRCNCCYIDEWTLADGENTVEQFAYKAFRYFTIMPDEGVEISSVSITVRHNPFDDNACVIESNDEILNSVFKICKNGTKYGSQDIFVDCPQREKGQYAGDSTVTTASSLWLTGDGRLTKKAMENQAQSACVCKGLLCVAPGHVMQEIADYTYQYPILSLRYYKFSGDMDFLRKNYETCLGIKEYSEKFRREDGLIVKLNDKGNLVDWPQNLLDGYDFQGLNAAPTKENNLDYPHNVINAYYIGFLYGVEEIERILGIISDGEADRTSTSFNKVFLNQETGLYVDSEISKHSALHSNILPLYYGFAPKENIETIADFIMKKKLCCGVYMAYFLLKALAKAGRYEDVYKLITSQDENSWYNMVREGGTTCFEAWGKDKKWNTSLCHPWASAPVSVLFEDILGLSLDGTKGESHIPEGLKIKVRTPMHGEIEF